MITVRANFRPAPKPGRRMVRQVPPSDPRPAPRQATRLARQLALAHHVERLIEDGAVADYAAVAKALGLSRARVTQLVSLTLLAPELQGRVLSGSVTGTERSLRAVVGKADWSGQVGQI